MATKESTLDKKAVLKEFEGWLRKKYKDIKIVHLYIGKQINGLKDTLVVVIDNVDVIEEKTFDYCGKMFDLCFKLWMRPSSECMRICKFENEHWHKIKDVKLAEIEQSLKMCSTSLFDEHSNLEIVSASAYRSKKNGENIIFEPCIVLYCSCKGVVPYKEKEFPKQIMGRNTDVREGFFYLFPNDRYFKRASDVLDPLMIGASIGRKDENKEGTLGGFVTLNNGEVGIITCGHVLYDFSTNVSPQTTAVEVVQPSYGYRNTNNVCGVHIKSILEIHQGVTVDASLAKLTDRVPQRGLFAELMTNDLLGVGFSLENLPEYASGSTRDYRKENTKRTNLCIKFGARSGLTKGFLCVNGMTARCRDEQMYLTNPASGSTCLYRSQLEFGGIATKPFAVEGDSGALVFQVDPKSSEEEDDKLFCIGMVVGGTSYCTTVVTPIESILESLNVKMHVFPEESMEQL
ncbi:uncharacterized protein LOC134257316 [Saccostrea cucullata]|uniref:uncharacterized protein LOC134257316 n=1 Tax=Saccostrea cuccullata TaxID=36930 RepID=UPI002ED1B73F